MENKLKKIAKERQQAYFKRNIPVVIILIIPVFILFFYTLIAPNHISKSVSTICLSISSLVFIIFFGMHAANFFDIPKQLQEINDLQIAMEEGITPGILDIDTSTELLLLLYSKDNREHFCAIRYNNIEFKDGVTRKILIDEDFNVTFIF